MIHTDEDFYAWRQRVQDAREALKLRSEEFQRLHAQGRERLRLFVQHVLPNRSQALSWCIDGDELAASPPSWAIEERNLEAWHDLHPGDLRFHNGKGSGREAFAATPVRWMVLTGLLLAFIGAVVVASSGLAESTRLKEVVESGYAFGVIALAFLVCLCTVGVVRTCEIVPAGPEPEGIVQVRYAVPLCLAGRHELARTTADSTYADAAQGFMQGRLWAFRGFLCLPSRHVDPADVCGVSMRTTPTGLIGFGIAAAFAIVVSAAAATAAWLDAMVPQSGFFAGVVRPIGWTAVIGWIGVVFGGTFALLSWIILGGWSHTERLIQLRMRRGRPIKVGTCHEMHARYVMHEVTELVAATRRGAAS